MADDFDIAKAFAELNTKVDKLTPAEREEIADDVADVESDVEEASSDASQDEEYDARAAIEKLSAKVDQLLAEPKTKAVRASKSKVPSAPARRPVKAPTATAPVPEKRRRGWFPQQ